MESSPHPKLKLSLEKHLVFPFIARVQEDAYDGSVRPDTQLRVLSITSLRGTYGTMVAVKHKSRVTEFPLCDLEPVEADTEIAQLVDDYSVWFANR